MTELKMKKKLEAGWLDVASQRKGSGVPGTIVDYIEY